jgi:hypothetical protein
MHPLKPTLTLPHAARAIARRTDVETKAFMMFSAEVQVFVSSVPKRSPRIDDPIRGDPIRPPDLCPIEYTRTIHTSMPGKRASAFSRSPRN